MQKQHLWRPQKLPINVPQKTIEADISGIDKQKRRGRKKKFNLPNYSYEYIP